MDSHPVSPAVAEPRSAGKRDPIGAAAVGRTMRADRDAAGAARPGVWTYMREVLRYGLSWTALRCYAYRFAYYVHDHVTPVAQMVRAGNPRIHATASLRCGYNIVLGRNSHINQYCCVWASPCARIILGDDLLMGPGAKLFASNHGMAVGLPMNQQPHVEKDIVVGNDVWIGANAVILAGVAVGDGAVIAAGSVVTRDVLPYTVVAGVPARLVRRRGQGRPGE